MFTTHTPVPAGIDRFETAQIQHFFDAGLAPDVPVAKILDLGAENYDGGNPSVFNMAVMGLRLAQRANGVAKLHGVVSRGMFSGLWPGFDHAEVPITSVTNGVHVPTWVDPRVCEAGPGAVRHRSVIDRAAGTSLTTSATRRSGRCAATLRATLVDDVRRRLRAVMEEARRGRRRAGLDRLGAGPGRADHRLCPARAHLQAADPDAARPGPAQGAAAAPERTRSSWSSPASPHPADDAGKKMIQDLVQFTDDPEVRHRIVFLPNYDIAMARTLFPGCDVWLNNPLRPLEACGTSGMKAAINGSLNLSVMDGWWDEMYDGENGWAIPTANSGATAERARRHRGGSALRTRWRPRWRPGSTAHRCPTAPAPPDRRSPGRGRSATHWISMIKHTLANLGPAVSADRMVQDYVSACTVPPPTSGHAAMADDYPRRRNWQRGPPGSATPGPSCGGARGLHGRSEEPQIGDTAARSTPTSGSVR